MERYTLPASDGISLAAYRWLPVGDCQRVLQISHGMAEHMARYDRLARQLNAHGIAVYGHDHRGHGHTAPAGRLGDFGPKADWGQVVADVLQVAGYARQQHPNRPIILLGHSMGSFIARAALQRAPTAYAGAVVSATGFRQAPFARLMSHLASWVGRRRGEDKPSTFLSKLAFGSFNLRFLPNRTAFDWLSRDAAEVDRYIADPLCGFDCSPRLWYQLLTGIAALEQDEKRPGVLPAAMPLWLIAGTHDPVSLGGLGMRQLAQRYQQAGAGQVSVSLYPAGRHELFNDNNRDEVSADLLRWLTTYWPKEAEKAAGE